MCIFDCVGDVCGVCMMCVYTSIAVILAWTPSQGRQNKIGPGAGRHPVTGSCCFGFIFFLCLSYTLPHRPGPEGPCPHLKALNMNSGGGGLVTLDTLPIPPFSVMEDNLSKAALRAPGATRGLGTHVTLAPHATSRRKGHFLHQAE